MVRAVRVWPPTGALLVLPASLVLLAGCVAGTATAPTGPVVGDEPPPGGGVGVGGGAVTTFAEVLPLLNASCGSCHTDPVQAPAFMAGPNVETTVLGWPNLVVPGAPDASTLITHGVHDGPAWPPNQAAVVRRWIVDEGAPPPVGGGGGPPVGGGGGGVPGVPGGLATTPITLVTGANRVDLDEVGLTNAYITFFAMEVALGMHLSDIRIASGATQGARIIHPKLVMWAGSLRTEDPDDRFSGVELSIVAGTSASLSTNVLLVGYPTGGELSFEFQTATPL